MKLKKLKEWFHDNSYEVIYLTMYCSILILLISLFILSLMTNKTFLLTKITIISLIFIITIFYIKHIYVKLKDDEYWTNFHKKYGHPDKPYIKLNIPFNLWCDLNLHFYLYDENGNVVDGTFTEQQAIDKHNETGLYITRIIDSPNR